VGLDVYVGTLTRYHAGDWETILQQSAADFEEPGPSAVQPTGSEAAELAVRHAKALATLRQAVEKLGGRIEIAGERPQLSEADRRRIERDVAAWQKRLARKVKGRIGGDFEWDETRGAPFFTDKPGWDGYLALVLWAAHEENPDVVRPTKLPEDWTKDPAWQASASDGFTTKYAQLIRRPEVWLPPDFPFTFEAKELGGKKITFGSSPTLLRELRILNERTWRADAATLGQWRFAGPDLNRSLELNARFAFAIFLELCGKSVAHRLPMKLDY